ncbi:MAG: hypothetical protein HoeaKO_00320 [Hoeflea alexandrii]
MLQLEIAVLAGIPVELGALSGADNDEGLVWNGQVGHAISLGWWMFSPVDTGWMLNGLARGSHRGGHPGIGQAALAESR